MADNLVVIPPEIRHVVQAHEIDVARVLSEHFKARVYFLVPRRGYKMKSADVLLSGVLWEIKSPTGASKATTIQKQFKGLLQSKNLVIDGRRMRLDDKFAIAKIKRELLLRKSAKRVLYIQKSGKILDCK